MGVAVALTLQALRPALAGETVRLRSDGSPQQARTRPQSVTVVGRIRYAPDLDGITTVVPPLAGSEGGEVVDCIAGCYATPRVAASEAGRLQPSGLALPVAGEMPAASGMQESGANAAPERVAPAARRAPVKLKPTPARRLAANQGRNRLGGSGDWFRRINDDRGSQAGR